ncbi:MAG: hypothetical protein JWM78_443 [Verrucomicrobiaceae bacterium]|nr:hypothetical protein [Verrucomicrobiaceae bacterium]
MKQTTTMQVDFAHKNGVSARLDLEVEEQPDNQQQIDIVEKVFLHLFPDDPAVNPVADQSRNAHRISTRESSKQMALRLGFKRLSFTRGVNDVEVVILK